MCRPEEGEPFRAPNDSVGVVLMTEHLRDKHNVGPLPADRRPWTKALPAIRPSDDS